MRTKVQIFQLPSNKSTLDVPDFHGHNPAEAFKILRTWFLHQKMRTKVRIFQLPSNKFTLDVPDFHGHVRLPKHRNVQTNFEVL